MLDRAEGIQTKTRLLMDRSEIALAALLDAIVAAKQRGVNLEESAESPGTFSSAIS